LNEDNDRKYKAIELKSVISNFVFVLTAIRPDYYGIKIVLSKESSKWIVLKKVESIF